MNVKLIVSTKMSPKAVVLVQVQKKLQRFRKLAPEAQHHPITLPAQLWEL